MAGLSFLASPWLLLGIVNLCVSTTHGILLWTCGGSRRFVGLVHFSVDVILLRDTGTLGRVRWFGRAAVFGWLGSCRHWGVGRCVHIDITRSTRVWFPVKSSNVYTCETWCYVNNVASIRAQLRQVCYHAVFHVRLFWETCVSKVTTRKVEPLQLGNISEPYTSAMEHCIYNVIPDGNISFAFHYNCHHARIPLNNSPHVYLLEQYLWAGWTESCDSSRLPNEMSYCGQNGLLKDSITFFTPRSDVFLWMEQFSSQLEFYEKSAASCYYCSSSHMCVLPRRMC